MNNRFWFINIEASTVSCPLSSVLKHVCSHVLDLADVTLNLLGGCRVIGLWGFVDCALFYLCCLLDKPCFQSGCPRKLMIANAVELNLLTLK